MEKLYPEDLVQTNSTLSLVIGIVLTVVGSVFMAIANTFMKLGLSDIKKRKAFFSNYSCDMKWYVGFVVYCFGSFLHIIALGFAPASTLAPMNSFGLIANAIVANIYLHEKLGKIEIISTFGTFFGVGICACASLLCKTEAVSFSSINIIESWKNPWYLFYISVALFLSFMTLVYLNYKENEFILQSEDIYSSKRYVEIQNHHEDGIKMKDFKDNGKDKNECIVSNSHIYPKGIGLSYGFLAGLIGSQCVLEIKEIVAIVNMGITNKHVYRSPLPYMCMVFLVLSIYLQIHFLNLGLSKGDATLVVPTYYVFWTFFGTLGGLVKFNEIRSFDANSILLFLFGFMLTVLFISILAVQEIAFLRKYVDKEVPDLPIETLDIHTQVMQNKKLSKQVLLNMGIFPVSLLGATVGRKRFRPLYERFRRTRSILSDTHIGDQYCEYSIDNNVYNAYTLPYDIYHTNKQKITSKEKSKGNLKSASQTNQASTKVNTNTNPNENSKIENTYVF